MKDLNENFENITISTSKFVPLSHTIIKRLFVLFAFLILVTTTITYTYLINKTEVQFRDHLLEYIVQRGKQESELFRLAKDNLLQLRNEFLFQYNSRPQAGFTDWFQSHSFTHKDGTIRFHQQYFDGLWNADWIFEHGIDVSIAPDTNISQEVTKRIGTAYNLLLKYGPAWHTRFLNLWFVGNEKLSLLYWPEIPRGIKESGDHSWKNEEWFSKTNMENNPSRGLVWTGLYFDSLAGHWMISVALPIDINGVHIGTIGTDLESGEFFNRNLSDSLVSSYSIILSKDGQIIVHPYKIGEMIASRDPKFTVESANDAQLKYMYEQIQYVSELPIIIESEGDDELWAVTRIEGPEWYLISVYYKALFKDQILKSAYFMIAIGLGSMLAALFMIYSVVRKNISQPLHLLTTAAANFDVIGGTEKNLKGFLAYLQKFKSYPGELGLLGRTLMKMGTRLRAVYRDLEKSKKNLEAEVSARTLDLVTAKEVAEASSLAKSKFLANMSHELRTPLNVILGFSRLMERDPSISPEQVENLELIHRSGDHLLALINDVLDMAKIESGQVAFTPQSFDLLYFLEGIAAMFQQRATENNLLFSFNEDPNIPQYITTDKGKLRQILFNLLGNAINYTDKGRVELLVTDVTVQVEEKNPPKHNSLIDKPDLWLRFEIHDTGRGINPRNLKSIFSQFVQEEPGSGEKSGTGLGLTISKGFTEKMGSELKVESRKGEGSVFWFDLPVGLGKSSEVVTVEHLRRPVGLAPNQPQYKILIVEDHGVSRLILNKLLLIIGFKVKTAANGEEGVSRFMQFEPDVVLMDIRMPKMDGLTATRKIKATESGSRTPIIALTAHAFENEKLDILAAGCDDFIRKPYDEREICNMLTKHIGVEFRYGDDGGATKAVTNLDHLGFARLPEQMVAELKTAAEELDFNRTANCIEQIKEIDVHLAKSLKKLADEFRFEQILTLTKRKSPGEEERR